MSGHCPDCGQRLCVCPDFAMRATFEATTPRQPTPPTPEAIEAGARAAYESGRYPLTWDQRSESTRDNWRRIARAVLSAAKETEQ